MTYLFKGRALQAHIFEGKEPPQFVALFQHMVVLKGGLSSGYKNRMIEKGSSDETYTATRRNQCTFSSAREFLPEEGSIITWCTFWRYFMHGLAVVTKDQGKVPAALFALTSAFNSSSGK
ncbi:predicted protein [Arabidopsis lyrata subsp. lyrata]|uniref:Predicted protein n=1 Tax=Arabidopsis lyrata subsp. lyrata TaxID=81972 RepID=D7KYQ7_ARALL|nr:predicted protein [Arabidopsis lyrata subsp. lyrata]